MRRNLILVFTIGALLFFNLNVKAETIDCVYDDVDLTMTYDLEKEFNPESNPFLKKGEYNSNSNTTWLLVVKWGKDLNNTDHTEIDQNLYKEVLDNYGCPTKMHLCTYIERSLDMPNLGADVIEALFTKDWEAIDGWLNFTSTLSIMTDKEYRDSDYSHYIGGGHYILGIDAKNCFWENVGDFIKALTGWGHEDIYAYRETECKLAEYKGPYIAINVNCSLLQNKLLADVKAIANYQSCGNDVSCKREAKVKVKEQEESVKAQCRSILENYNYTGGEAECIDACLSIRETLNELKKDTDLYEDLSGKTNNDCGFSQRLGIWILNIFRWIKYILPVIVIVLGILDFIKAIGSDKEDEMKKAQKNFIIRLIAAVLVFIIPLIIEFVLIKMGFVYEGCGLFD